MPGDTGLLGSIVDYSEGAVVAYGASLTDQKGRLGRIFDPGEDRVSQSLAGGYIVRCGRVSAGGSWSSLPSAHRGRRLA